MVKKVTICGCYDPGETFRVFCLYCDKPTPHIDAPFEQLKPREVKCTICGETQETTYAIFTSKQR